MTDQTDLSEMTSPRLRIREWMAIPDHFAPGERNTICDVPGVTVGHTTLIAGQNVRSGVTIVRPHAGDPFLLRCPCHVHTGNGFGKLTGALQVNELGELESLIGLTNTLSLPQVVQGILEVQLAGLTMSVRSLNVLAGETNDGFLNDIRGFHVRPEHVKEAVARLSQDVEEGAVGAGTGTVCFGYKGGIGSASRRVEDYMLGALVQTNFGGRFQIYGLPLPVGMPQASARGQTPGAGSCMIVLAVNAPLDARQLGRLARRGILGLARTGSFLDHGSGDFCIAFSNHPGNLRPHESRLRRVELLSDEQLSPFFEAAVEAVTEAIYNSLTMAGDMTGRDGNRVEGLNLARFAERLPLLRQG